MTSVPCHAATDDLDNIDTIINCTPVGMQGGSDPDGDPAQLLAPYVEIAPPLTVIDTVYAPPSTPLLIRAEKMGCTTINGEAMFRLQAVAQQAIWS